MPIEKTPNYIRIRVASPKKFSRFFVKTLGKGIKAVMGVGASGKSQIQSLLFPRKRYTLKTAKAWVKSHGYSVSECYWVMGIDIDPITFDLILEETVARSDKEVPNIDVIKMKKDVFAWLVE